MIDRPHDSRAIDGGAAARALRLIVILRDVARVVVVPDRTYAEVEALASDEPSIYERAGMAVTA